MRLLCSSTLLGLLLGGQAAPVVPTPWTVMEGGGVASGDVILEIDAASGAIVGKITQK